jgi:LmbE family N-acetylglucosaminyl deacetylase
MMKLSLGRSKGGPRRILCLGAHCDDIEIGCGGTILKLLADNRSLEVRWVVFSSDVRRAKEARRAASRFLKAASARSIQVTAFKDAFFPFLGSDIKQHFQKLYSEFSPDLIFTHCKEDLHQDHRVIAELTWNTFRNHMILEYEIPKYDGDFRSPNVFVHLDERLCQRKIEYIMECFPSQHDKQWFTSDTFLATLRLRGVESNSPTRYAEGFYCRKLIM